MWRGAKKFQAKICRICKDSRNLRYTCSVLSRGCSAVEFESVIARSAVVGKVCHGSGRMRYPSDGALVCMYARIPVSTHISGAAIFFSFRAEPCTSPPPDFSRPQRPWPRIESFRCFGPWASLISLNLVLAARPVNTETPRETMDLILLSQS